MTYDQLELGKTYVCIIENKNYIFLLLDIEKATNPRVSLEDKFFSLTSNWKAYSNFREASRQEKEHLQVCIRENKYISAFESSFLDNINLTPEFSIFN